jgi:glutamyl-tRNA(Gln) amidotransferase subunit E
MTAPLDFKFKPFDQMTPEDYATIGFMSGLEIHQQLLTQRKLFCRCPAGHYSERVDAEILRHMRPTLSELGEYDGTALMEFKTRKEILYLLNKDTVCTYEMDDAPPFEIDPEAVNIALEIGLLLKLNLVSELHIARKQYLDGSIPTGFQRTTILGVDGEIEVNGRPIGIIQLGLEEDSCREVSDVGHRITFRTDRLGMPLVETVTYPEMRTPQEVADAADVIRQLTRATGKVRTGAGAGRQDVNVSIDGGTRIEIKGVPSIKRIPLLVYNEAMRQHNLLKIREILRQRGITAETIKAETSIVTHLVKDTSYLPISVAFEKGGEVGAVRLAGFREILNHPTQEHTYFSQEIADRVKVIACLMDYPNIVYSDATGINLSRGQWNRIRKRLHADLNEDSIVLVWGSRQDVETAMNEIIIRAREACEGVPSETRQALRDGTNGFERILPGPNRMYPDTDEPPQAIEDETVKKAMLSLPERPWERTKRLRELGLPMQVIEILVRSGWWSCFDPIHKETGCDPRLLAFTCTRDLRYFSRRGYDLSRLTPQMLSELFRRVRSGQMLAESVHYVLKAFLESSPRSLENVLDEFTPDPGDMDRLADLLEQSKDEQKRLINQGRASRLHYLTGFVLSSLRGRIAAQVVVSRLEKVVDGHDD